MHSVIYIQIHVHKRTSRNDYIISLSDPADSTASGSIVPLGYVEHLPIFLRMPISTYMSVFLFIHLSIHIDPSSYPYPSNQQSSMHPSTNAYIDPYTVHTMMLGRPHAGSKRRVGGWEGGREGVESERGRER